MAQNITNSVMTMVQEAKKEIEEIPPEDAIKLHGNPDIVLVDIRDPRELERDGQVPGAFRVTRGMREVRRLPPPSANNCRWGWDR
jgi:rhodanese-related sulfurtransferase